MTRLSEGMSYAKYMNVSDQPTTFPARPPSPSGHSNRLSLPNPKPLPHDLLCIVLQSMLTVWYVFVLQLYTVSYNYCTSSRMNSGGVSEMGGNRSGANLMGSDLYKHLNHYFVSHLKTVRAKAEDLSDEPLLNYYTKEWDRYTTGASYVNRLFTYLNRHWVKREKDEGRKNVYTVYILALVQWKDHFYKHASRIRLRPGLN